MQILVQVATAVVLALLGSLVTPLIDDWLRRGHPLPRRRHILIGAVGALLGATLGLGIIYATLQAFREPEVRITSPAERGTLKDCPDQVRGTFSHLDAGQEIWLMVVPSGSSSYYPQNGPATLLGAGEWSSGACLGGKGDFDILAVVPDSGIRTAFEVYRDACNATKHCPPVTELWEGVTVMDKISVVA